MEAATRCDDKELLVWLPFKKESISIRPPVTVLIGKSNGLTESIKRDFTVSALASG